MATERLSMRKTREVLHLKWVQGRSHREIHRSTGVSVATVSETASRALRAGLDWAGVEKLSDAELETLLYPPAPRPGVLRTLPNPAHVHLELKRPGVTLRLLHLEYLEKHTAGYGYTQFCQHYKQWLGKQPLTMRQVHRGGDKLFVDYAGKRPQLLDPKTGEATPVELFVAVLGASNYTYVEASLTQQSHDFIGSHLRALEFLGGSPCAIVPDQLRSGVSTPGRYEPTIQRTYQEMARHYGTVILPARPRHPRDKAKVEVAVQLAERWILARLRNQRFFCLDELNQRIWELTDELNDRMMRRYGESRRQLFERLDRPALRALPSCRFTYGEWKYAKVNLDYHIELEHHYYSVPHGLVHQKVEARISATTVEVYHQGQRVAAHPRSLRRAQHTTIPEHMPKAHQKHLEWSPSRLTHWGASIGPQTAKLVESILADRPHPEQGYRSCLGIFRLAKSYSPQRLEAACARALSAGGRSFRHVESILKAGLDAVAVPIAAADPVPAVMHDNIRGPSYYN